MATYTLGARDVAAHRKTLTANAADTVAFAVDLPRVEVVNHGTADLFVSVDGSTAVLAGPRCFLVTPGASLDVAVPTQGPTKVGLISSAAGAYTVQASS